MTETPDLGIHRTALGIHSFGPDRYSTRWGWRAHDCETL